MKAIVLLCASVVLVVSAGCRCGCMGGVPPAGSGPDLSETDEVVQTQLMVEVQSGYGRIF